MMARMTGLRGMAMCAARSAAAMATAAAVREWAAADHDRLSASLAEFMGGHPYRAEMLHHDLARFRSLFSADRHDIEFLRAPRYSYCSGTESCRLR